MSLSHTALTRSFRDFFAEQRYPQQAALLLSERKMSERRYSSSGGEGLPAPIQEHSLQTQLRPAYGKGDPEFKKIGTHPDFEDLAGTLRSRTSPIVTLFMDIESSTRLGLFYSGEQVARIKNAFLCTAIELVHAFDGHVHRIMGDAVMAFFGGEGQKPEDAAIDAINCASTLWYFVKSTVIPALHDEGYDEDFGIRVGVDFAPEAHWSAYGFPGVEEVSAAAFEVDAASKLQHVAGRNQVMLGQGIVDLIDLPMAVTSVKRVQRNGVMEDVPYLQPNHTLRDGSSHNYRQALLRIEEYLRCSPLAPAAAELIQDRRFRGLDVRMTLHKTWDSPVLREYHASSFCLPKDHFIRFEVSLPFQPRLPITVEFSVENHGKQAVDDNGDDMGNHKTAKQVTGYLPHQPVVHWEGLSYRGLHYMTIAIRDAEGTVIARRRIGVFID